MANWRISLMAVATLGVGACTQQPVPGRLAEAQQSRGPEARAVTAPISFRCLPSGTVTTYSTGSTITWLGTDPGADDICIGRNGQGRPIQFVRGIWNIGGYWPDSIPALRSAITDLTTKPPGTVTSFTVTGRTGNQNDPRPGTWVHSLRILDRESITVPAGRFDAYVIEDDSRTSPGRGHWVKRFFIDTATGVPLKWETVSSSNSEWPKEELLTLRLPRS